MPDLAPLPEYTGNEPCRTTDPDAFFPDTSRDAVQQPTAEEIAMAKSICDGCDLLRACRAYAMDHEVWGIWGGTDLAERTAAKGLRRLEPHFRSASDPNAVRRDLIRRLDDGTRSAAEIAVEAGCSKRTVDRVRAARRTPTQKGTAA
jgi:WhiB family redox-sensing transcriptional regulator